MGIRRYSNPAMLKNWTCEYWLNSLAWVVPNVISKQTTHLHTSTISVLYTQHTHNLTELN